MSKKELWTYSYKYSFTALTKKYLIKKLLDNLSEFYCHLVQFSVSTIDGPTDVETKFHFTRQPREHIRRHPSNSRCHPSTQTGKRDYPLMYPQKKKSMGVKSGLCAGQLIGPPLPIHQPGNRSSKAVRTMAPK
jgi:hypothetical protein